MPSMSGSGGGDVASSSAGSRSEILVAIEKLFSWNPPRLDPQSFTETPAIKASTRSPAFYDKHFDSRLILQEVKPLPSLVQDLAANVDKMLIAASATLPALIPALTSEHREDREDALVDIGPGEKAVANYYSMTTGEYCARVASTLALHPTAQTSKWRSLIHWTDAVNSSGHAIIDGELRFKIPGTTGDDGKLRSQELLESMDPENRRIYETMRESRACLATWEFMSTTVGSKGVMNAVRNLGKFSWTHCPGKSWKKLEKHLTELKHAAMVFKGPDARRTPWKLDTGPPADPDETTGTTLPITDAPIQLPCVSMPLPLPSNKVAVYTPPIQGTNAGTSAQTPRRSGRFLGKPAVPHTSTSSIAPPPLSKVPEPTSSVRGKGKRKASPVEREEAKRKRDEAYKDPDDKIAEKLVRRAWAQAIKFDTTIIVLNSGNYELVCLRHRKTNTLYVSDLIEPPACKDPGYGKLHVGICIAAVQDAIERKKQSEEEGQQQHLVP